MEIHRELDVLGKNEKKLNFQQHQLCFVCLCALGAKLNELLYLSRTYQRLPITYLSPVLCRYLLLAVLNFEPMTGSVTSTPLMPTRHLLPLPPRH